MRIPSGTATIQAPRKLPTTLRILMPISFRKLPLKINENSVVNTFSGGGTSSGFTFSKTTASSQAVKKITQIAIPRRIVVMRETGFLIIVLEV
jgi:hypothetical protein